MYDVNRNFLEFRQAKNALLSKLWVLFLIPKNLHTPQTGVHTPHNVVHTPRKKNHGIDTDLCDNNFTKKDNTK
jgi:hypothetical protein